MEDNRCDIHKEKYKDNRRLLISYSGNIGISHPIELIIEGIDKEISQVIIKHIKEKKNKVQTSIQGDQIRVQGKKRDDLQDIITSLKTVELKIPINFINFRD